VIEGVDRAQGLICQGGGLGGGEVQPRSNPRSSSPVRSAGSKGASGKGRAVGFCISAGQFRRALPSVDGAASTVAADSGQPVGAMRGGVLVSQSGDRQRFGGYQQHVLEVVFGGLAGVDEGRTGRLEFGERRAMSGDSWESVRGRSSPRKSAAVRSTVPDVTRTCNQLTTAGSGLDPSNQIRRASGLLEPPDAREAAVASVTDGWVIRAARVTRNVPQSRCHA
jgi:hypothetical protein